MISHSEAREIFQIVAPDLTLPERLVAQAIALHESSYGAGWKEGRGAGSHNWGAIMRPSNDDGPFFVTQDSRPGKPGEADVVPFQGKFKVYPDDGAGALDVVRVGLKANVRQAAEAKSLRGVAEAMFKNVYFTGTSQSPTVNIERYRQALENAILKITGETGEENPFPKAPASPVASGSAPSSSPGSSLPVLRAGDSGSAVDALRLLLRIWNPAASLATLPGLPFDDRALAQVKAFQGGQELLIDGVVGPKTWEKLQIAAREQLSRPHSYALVD